MAAGEPKEITVRIIVEAQATVDVEVPVENITVNHLADGLELRFNSQTVIMHITGYSEELSRIDAGELTGRIECVRASGGGSSTWRSGWTGSTRMYPADLFP